MELWQEIQAAVDYGFQIAANIVGIPHLHYRPITATNPISVTNQLVNQSVLIDRHSGKFKYEVPEVHGKPYRDAILDVIACKNGDYLISTVDGNISFISSIEPLEYTTIIKCNRTVSLTRMITTPVFGTVGHGGTTAQTIVAGYWPCSVLQGTKGEHSVITLPRDTRQPWFSILLPLIPGVILETEDDLIDDLGQHYEISSAEQTEMGWRLSAELAKA